MACDCQSELENAEYMARSIVSDKAETQHLICALSILDKKQTLIGQNKDPEKWKKYRHARETVKAIIKHIEALD